jgi:drug/metabolite transporter (DMT)-like permease
LDRKALGAVAFTLLVWSSAFAGIRAGLRAFAPGHLLLLRFLVASLTMGAYAVVARVPLPPVREWPRLAVVGLVGITLYMAALTYGEEVVPAATAGFLVASSPVFTALFAAVLLGERPGVRALAGIVVGLGGEALIAFGAGDVGRLGPGVALVLLAAVATALFFALEKPLLERHPASHVTAWVTWSGTAPFVAFVPGFAHQLARAPLGATLAVVYLGVMPAAVGYVTWAYALHRLPTARAMSFLYLNPLLAAAIAWLWLGERPGWNTWVGGAVVLAGVAVVQTARMARTPSTSPAPPVPPAAARPGAHASQPPPPASSAAAEPAGAPPV